MAAPFKPASAQRQQLRPEQRRHRHHVDHHYRRPAGDDTGWTVHTFDATVETTWAAGLVTTTSDSFGAVVQLP